MYDTDFFNIVQQAQKFRYPHQNKEENLIHDKTEHAPTAALSCVFNLKFPKYQSKKGTCLVLITVSTHTWIYGYRMKSDLFQFLFPARSRLIATYIICDVTVNDQYEIYCMTKGDPLTPQYRPPQWVYILNTKH